VVTVDTPVAANRENNIRNGFSTPLRPSLRLGSDGITHPAWFLGASCRRIVKHGKPHFENKYSERRAPIRSSTVLRDFSDRGHLTWGHVRECAKCGREIFVIKGFLNPPTREPQSISAQTRSSCQITAAGNSTARLLRCLCWAKSRGRYHLCPSCQIVGIRYPSPLTASMSKAVRAGDFLLLSG
jgi:hypothetical protein